jgi:putative transcriptional regulator
VIAESAEPLRRRSLPMHRDTSHIIRSWRRRVGLTQEGLAEALSVTFSTVSRWENGHVTPSNLAWRALERFAATCGVPLDAENGVALAPQPYQGARL